MYFGLTGAPHSFQRPMNLTLAPLLRKCVLVFFDDILVYSKFYEEHIVHLDQVLNILLKEQWTVKLCKCSFAQRQISNLGYVISADGVATCLDKIQVVVDWHVPKSVKELRSFLGLVGYYRKFIKHFGVISRPFTELLKKNTLFVWTQDHDIAFQTLKSLIHAPVLALPDFSKPFCIETDASEFGVGAILMQEKSPYSFCE
jgi:hypothetical protein